MQVKPRQDPDGWNMPGQDQEKEEPERKEEEEEADPDNWDSSALEKMSGGVVEVGWTSVAGSTAAAHRVLCHCLCVQNLSILSLYVKA